jgi:hypothetical protein
LFIDLACLVRRCNQQTLHANLKRRNFVTAIRTRAALFAFLILNAVTLFAESPSQIVAREISSKNFSQNKIGISPVPSWLCISLPVTTNLLTVTQSFTFYPAPPMAATTRISKKVARRIFSIAPFPPES